MGKGVAGFRASGVRWARPAGQKMSELAAFILLRPAKRHWRAQPALECGGLTPPWRNGKKALHDPARGGSRRARPTGQRKANASFYRTVMRFGIERLKVPDEFEVVWSPETR